LLKIETDVIDAIEQRKNALNKIRRYQIIVVNKGNVFACRLLSKKFTIFANG